MSICLALVRRTAVIRTSKGTWHANLLDQGAGAAPRARTRQASRPRRGIHRSRSDGRRPEGGGLRAAQSEHEGANAGRRRSRAVGIRSEEHTSELQSLMRISYAVLCLKKK